MRRLDTKEHDIYKYVIISIYISSNINRVVLIHRKIYIVEDFFVKVFIDINIIKSEVIIFDINKDLIIIESCSSL